MLHYFGEDLYDSHIVIYFPFYTKCIYILEADMVKKTREIGLNYMYFWYYVYKMPNLLNFFKLMIYHFP
jgi:hypothetical protein